MEDSVSISIARASCIKHLKENLERVIQCLEFLNESQIWNRFNESSNAVGNLVLHLNGNIGQYILSSLGKTKDTRTRPEEFNPERRLAKSSLIETHSAVVHSAIDTISGLDSNEFHRKRVVQGFDLNGLEILIHVTEHSSYHTGQIALMTKMYLNKDLGFYGGMDLNVLNKDS